MKFKGIIGSEHSGSVAGLTFSHNRGGQYIRQRVIPINPNSVFQMAIRAFVAQLTSLWNNVLTAPQRTAWNTYAANVLIPDRLGEPRNIGGLGQYVRTNVARLQAAVPRQDVAPTIFNLGEFTTPVPGAINAAADTWSIAFTNTDAWANEVDGMMTIAISRPVNASINFFKGPYRFAAVVDGAAIPPATPVVVALPFLVAAGQRLFLQIRFGRADGRLTLPFRGTGVAA